MSVEGVDPIPCSISPDQELTVLKLILELRALGDVEESEKLRRRVRKAILQSSDDARAIGKVDELIRRGRRTQSKLDGTYEERQRQKQARREKALASASRLVDIEAGSGDDTEGSESSEEAEDMA